MFFRRRKTTEPTQDDGWRELAERLDLERLDDGATDAVRGDLGIDSGHVTAMHAWRREGLPELFLFEYARARPGQRNVEPPRVRVVLRADAPRGERSWRAFPTSHPLVSSLQASRTGGELVRTGVETFDDRIALVSRDPERTRDDLSPAIREALTRLLDDGGMPDATVTCGRQHLAWRAHGEVDAAGDVLEAVAARLLVLWLATDPDNAYGDGDRSG